MHDRSGVDLRDPFEDPFFQFLFGFDANLLQKRVRHLSEERFHQVEPRGGGRGKMQMEAVFAGEPINALPSAFGDTLALRPRPTASRRPRNPCRLQRPRHLLTEGMLVLSSLATA